MKKTIIVLTYISSITFVSASDKDLIFNQVKTSDRCQNAKDNYEKSPTYYRGIVETCSQAGAYNQPGISGVSGIFENSGFSGNLNQYESNSTHNSNHSKKNKFLNDSFINVKNEDFIDVEDDDFIEVNITKREKFNEDLSSISRKYSESNHKLIETLNQIKFELYKQENSNISSYFQIKEEILFLEKKLLNEKELIDSLSENRKNSNSSNLEKANQFKKNHAELAKTLDQFRESLPNEVKLSICAAMNTNNPSGTLIDKTQFCLKNLNLKKSLHTKNKKSKL